MVWLRNDGWWIIIEIFSRLPEFLSLICITMCTVAFRVVDYVGEPLFFLQDTVCENVGSWDGSRFRRLVIHNVNKCGWAAVFRIHDTVWYPVVFGGMLPNQLLFGKVRRTSNIWGWYAFINLVVTHVWALQIQSECLIPFPNAQRISKIPFIPCKPYLYPHVRIYPSLAIDNSKVVESDVWCLEFQIDRSMLEREW